MTEETANWFEEGWNIIASVPHDYGEFRLQVAICRSKIEALRAEAVEALKDDSDWRMVLVESLVKGLEESTRATIFKKVVFPDWVIELCGRDDLPDGQKAFPDEIVDLWPHLSREARAACFYMLRLLEFGDLPD